MFSWQHFLWLAICIAGITASLVCLKKNKTSLSRLLDYAAVICILSEVTKVFSVMEMVASEDGSIIFPYIPMNHLPLHMCSIQILLIFYVRATKNKEMREKILSFMYPSCLLGAIAALAMPSIFTTSITVDQAFTHPMAYQFFVYHSMLVVLGLYIAMSGEIQWEKKHIFSTLKTIFAFGFISLYVNSIFASPSYLNGKLQHVDFWPNFFFTYNNPLNIKLTELWQWHLYLIIISLLVIVLVTLCFLPLLRKKKQ